MLIRKISLKNFRCFEDMSFNFDGGFTIVRGDNGKGKTTLLESLYYSCYLHSFKTRRNQEIVSLGQKHFFIDTEIDFDDSGGCDSISVGFDCSQGKRVKFNKKTISSYKEIVDLYKIIAISSDDIHLISGYPEQRRNFLNHALFYQDMSFAEKFKLFQKILNNRNKYLRDNIHNPSILKDEQFVIWSKKLFEISHDIAKIIIYYLADIGEEVNDLVKYLIDKDLNIKFSYQTKYLHGISDFDFFWEHYKKNIYDIEFKCCRTMFGIHLNDFNVMFQNKKARVYSSRGQQKLVAFLIKIAQIRKMKMSGFHVVMLIDDFFSDFDKDKIEKCINIVESLGIQVIITTPLDLKREYFRKSLISRIVTL